MKSDENSIWFHGSPYRLIRLLAGSTITQDRQLAEVFSHKPTIVSVEDDGRIRHNGILPGYLYIFPEPLTPDDLEPVPHSTMEPGKEFLTRRELPVRMIGPVEINPKELLLPKEIREFKQRSSKKGTLDDSI